MRQQDWCLWMQKDMAHVAAVHVHDEKDRRDRFNHNERLEGPEGHPQTRRAGDTLLQGVGRNDQGKGHGRKARIKGQAQAAHGVNQRCRVYRGRNGHQDQKHRQVLRHHRLHIGDGAQRQRRGVNDPQGLKGRFRRILHITAGHHKEQQHKSDQSEPERKGADGRRVSENRRRHAGDGDAHVDDVNDRVNLLQLKVQNKAPGKPEDQREVQSHGAEPKAAAKSQKPGVLGEIHREKHQPHGESPGDAGGDRLIQILDQRLGKTRDFEDDEGEQEDRGRAAGHPPPFAKAPDQVAQSEAAEHHAA